MTKRGFGWLALCLAAARSARCSAQQAADHVALGIAAEEAHDLTTALQHYDAALSQDSSSYEANWRGAMTLLSLGEQITDAHKNSVRDSLVSQAERYAARAVASNPVRGRRALCVRRLDRTRLAHHGQEGQDPPRRNHPERGTPRHRVEPAA